MGIDRVGIVIIRKTSKNKQIFIDRARNDRVRNDWLPKILESLLNTQQSNLVLHLRPK